MPFHVSLRRDEAEARAALITVTRVHVELDLRDAGDHFTSITSISFDCHDPGACTFVDFCGASLDELVLNGERIEAPGWAEGRIPLNGLAGHNELRVRGTMVYSSDGEGLYRHVDAADGETYLYAMSFLDAAPRWFASFDQPDLKAPHGFTVHTPDHWTVVGNQPAHQVSPGQWEIAPGHPLSSYVVTLAAGPWHRVGGGHHGRNSQGRPVALDLYARRSLAAQLDAEADDILAVTRASLDAYAGHFASDYPFHDYAQVFAPDFNAGAMENPGCVVFREQYLGRGPVSRRERANRAGTICHEMAHQWFGDLVTMRWWDELWLNESFAEFMGHRVATEAAGYPLWTQFGLFRKQWGMDADLGPASHPVAGNGAADARAALANFDGISYAKGAAVLRQLAEWMGTDRFEAGLRQHFAHHAYGNATMADLLEAWRAQGVEGLDEWVRAWLTTSGADLVRVAQDEPPSLLREGNRPHSLRLAVHGPDCDTGHRLLVEQERTPLPSAGPGSLLLPDADDRCWARVRPAVVGSSDPWNFPLDRLATASRVTMLSALRDAWRHAEVGTGRALGLLLTQLSAEPDDDVLAWMTAQLPLLAGTWSPPARRGARRGFALEVVDALLAQAEPGSDRHLLLTRFVLDLVDDTERLEQLLAAAGEHALAPDERWKAVRRSVTLGADPALVDRELQRDRSSAGELAAATARALVPTPEAKQQALRLVLEPSGASAYQVQATAAGLFPAEQHELTAPLARRWLAGIAATAEFRSGWALAAAVRAGFPASHADRATLTAARSVLRAPGLDPSLARALGDAVAELELQVSALSVAGP